MRMVRGKRRATRACVLCLGLLVGSGDPVAASEDEASASEAAPPSPGAPVATVLGGIGNALGGFGMQAEYYLGGGRFSVFGGMGYYSGGDDNNYPSGLAGAGGARVYAGGVRHRGFLELAVAPVAGT